MFASCEHSDRLNSHQHRRIIQEVESVLLKEWDQPQAYGCDCNSMKSRYKRQIWKSVKSEMVTGSVFGFLFLYFIKMAVYEIMNIAFDYYFSEVKSSVALKALRKDQ